MAWWELSCLVAVQEKKIKEMFLFFFFPTLHNCLFSSTKCKDPKFRKHTEFFFFNGVLILIQIEKPLANTHVQTETSLENKETTTSLKQTLTFLTVVSGAVPYPDPYDPNRMRLLHHTLMSHLTQLSLSSPLSRHC